MEIYTDGACEMSSRRGGWAYVVVNQDSVVAENWGNDTATTNNKMELTALMHGLLFALSLDTEVTIFTDSQYCSNGYNDWCHNWKKKNWKTSTNKKVENLELWQTIDSIRSPKIKVRWVRGHDGNKWNEYCDSLTRNYE